MSTLERRGFTLVELSLSIAFIAILSIIIVVLVTNTISSYRRGLTLNKINSVGMDLVDEIRATVQNSSSSAVTNMCHTNFDEASDSYKNCMDHGGKNFVSMVNYNNDGEPLYGVFCTGDYSYIWNSGYYFSNDNNKIGDDEKMLSLKKEGSNDKKEGSKLLKMKDSERKVCSAWISEGGDYNKPSFSEVITVPEIVYSTATEGILEGEKEGSEEDMGDLAIYYLDTTEPAESESGHNLFYSISFILGTIKGGISINASGNFCSTLGNKTYEDMDFCAINKFNFAVRATGE